MELRTPRRLNSFLRSIEQLRAQFLFQLRQLLLAARNARPAQIEVYKIALSDRIAAFRRPAMPFRGIRRILGPSKSAVAQEP